MPNKLLPHFQEAIQTAVDLPKTFTLMSQRDHFKMLWKAQCFTPLEITRRLRMTRKQLFELMFDIEMDGELDPPFQD